MEHDHRLHSLDAVRAFALLLGIAFHATMSFVPTLTSMGWPISDSSQSDTLAAAFFVLHIFRMTTFFVIAGFFARLVVHRKGLGHFIKDRRKRILVPLLVSLPIQLALLAGVIIWGATKAGLSLTGAAPPPRGIVLLPFPWSHLWFLYVLLLLYATVLGMRWFAITVIDRDRRFRVAIDSAIAKLLAVPLAPLPLALPVAICLYRTDWWWLWEGIPTPDNSLIPNLPAFTGYATAAFFGWFLHRQPKLLQAIERFWLGYLSAAIALTLLCYSMVGMPTSPITLDATHRAIYSGSYGLAIWCWTFAVIGSATKFLAGESKIRRYLADASYWMYIMHLPLVFALQALMMQWPLHWSIKYPLILMVTFSVLLLSYRYWVRPTFIGQALNGRRYPLGQ